MGNLAFSIALKQIHRFVWFVTCAVLLQLLIFHIQTGPPVQLTPETSHIPEVFVPQREYRPSSPTNIPAALRTTIKFCTKSGSGFPVKDALEGRYADLVGRDDTNMFQQCSSSISIRIEVSLWRFSNQMRSSFRFSGLDISPGDDRYASNLFTSVRYWMSCLQMKTKDWCKPSRPINLAKLATEVAKLLRAFMDVRVESLYLSIQRSLLPLGGADPARPKGWPRMESRPCRLDLHKRQQGCAYISS
jgi:hypothetical protein